jgi:DNA-binding response OmpR family regulator
MTTKALVVEDNPQIIDAIDGPLASLRHEYRWVTNQADAFQALESEDFAYVLLDLEIPPRPGRGGGTKEYGENVLHEIQRLKGQGCVPVIIMSSHVAYALNRAVELREWGATEFIAKPFPTEGRTLASVIRKVLQDRSKPNGSAPPGKSKPHAGELNAFSGGELVFFEDRVELLGVKIITDRGAGTSLLVLRELSCRNGRDRYVRLSADDLARALRVPGGVGAITSAIQTIRRNITQRLSRDLDVVVPKDGVIGHDEQGYFLREWIAVAEAARANHDERLAAVR